MIAKKKGPHDEDPFGIKASGNMVDKEHRTATRGDENHPVQPYEEWLAENSAFDPINPDNIAVTPWRVVRMDDEWAAKWRSLRSLLPKLRGRQKQVLEALLDGVYSPTEIGRRISMDQRDVVDVILVLRKKISDGIP